MYPSTYALGVLTRTALPVSLPYAVLSIIRSVTLVLLPPTSGWMQNPSHWRRGTLDDSSSWFRALIRLLLQSTCAAYHQAPYFVARSLLSLSEELKRVVGRRNLVTNETPSSAL